MCRPTPPYGLGCDFAEESSLGPATLAYKLDPNITKNRPLKFIAHGLGYSDKKYSSIENFYIDLKLWKIPLSETIEKVDTINLMYSYYKKIEKIRGQINYDIDGIVYKVNDYNIQNRLGFVGKNPRWAVALKFSAEKTSTKIFAGDDLPCHYGKYIASRHRNGK